MSLERRNESLTGKCHVADLEKMVCEWDNKQLKNDISQARFLFEREMRENLRQIEDMKREHEILIETKTLEFKRQLDSFASIAKEKEQEFKTIIEKQEKEILKLNNDLADKKEEVQTLKVNHNKEIKEITEKIRVEENERRNQLIESHSNDLYKRSAEIDRMQNENTKMKKELTNQKTDFELLEKKISHEMELRNIRFCHAHFSDLQLQIETSQKECKALEKDLEREKEKSQKLGKTCIA